ncbi:hypothetical protein GGX14DRAFT_409332 [Mycena pura]|uniref:Uncharacterized protein n=1 Tax=Mycena pura TaxID=153505 RepID=A0AAD6UNK0_9AGAR|nr:hypothetical protein GGX14DRAFT_409332 [Mycena pura]
MCRALDMCPWRDSRTSGSEKLIARGLDSYWADARHSGQPSPTWIRSAQGAVPRTGQPACCPTKFLRASGNLTAWLELGCQAEDWMLATMEKDENGNAVLDQRVQVDSGFHMPVEYTATLAPGSYWSVVRGNIELRNGLEAQMKCWQKGILNPQEVLLSRRMSAEMESEKRINIYIRLPIIKKGLSVTHQLLRLQRNTEARLSILVGHNGDPLAAIPVSPAPHGQTLILHVYSPRSVASILSSSDELMAPVVIPGIDLPLITGPLVTCGATVLYGILIVQVYPPLPASPCCAEASPHHFQLFGRQRLGVLWIRNSDVQHSVQWLPKANLACTTISANAGECCVSKIFAVARDETCLNVVLHLRQRELCGTGAPLRACAGPSEKSGGTHLDRLRDFRVDDSELASSSAAQGRPCYDRSRESWRWAAAGRQGRAGQTAEMRRVGGAERANLLVDDCRSPAASATSRKRSEAPGLQLFCVTEERERAGEAGGGKRESDTMHVTGYTQLGINRLVFLSGVIRPGRFILMVMYVNEFTCHFMPKMKTSQRHGTKDKRCWSKTKTPKTDSLKIKDALPKTKDTHESKDVKDNSRRADYDGGSGGQQHKGQQGPLVPDMAPRYCNARGGAVALLAVLYLPSLRQEEYARQRTESGKRNAVGSDAVCGGLQDDGWARYCNGQRPAGSGQLAAGGGRRAAVTPGEGQSERHESPDARRQWSCIDAFVILVTAFNAVSARTIEGFLDIEEQYRSLYKDLLTRTAGALKFRLPATSAELLQRNYGINALHCSSGSTLPTYYLQCGASGMGDGGEYRDSARIGHGGGA